MIKNPGTSLAVPWLRLHDANTWGHGFDPWSKIPHAAWQGHKKNVNPYKALHPLCERCKPSCRAHTYLSVSENRRKPQQSKARGPVLTKQRRLGKTQNYYSASHLSSVVYRNVCHSMTFYLPLLSHSRPWVVRHSVRKNSGVRTRAHTENIHTYR